MAVRVAVDFGTSSTCVVLSVHGREPQVVVVDGHPLMSSAVYATPDGTLFVGQEAERHAAVDPARYEPHPKRRMGENELLLGAQVFPMREIVHAVLARAVGEARRLVGGAAIETLVLTHPVEWGIVRTQLLRQAAAQLADQVELVPEPVAAAFFHGTTFSGLNVVGAPTHPGVGASGISGQRRGSLAVLDLGGGTVDVSVVSNLPAKGPDGVPLAGKTSSDVGWGDFRVLATKGEPHWGGADVDQALLEYVGDLVSHKDLPAWLELVEGRDLTHRRRRRVLQQDVRGAKETLSRHAYTDVPMPQPFPDAHVTRNDLEKLITEPLRAVVSLVPAAIQEAGLRPQELAGIFLVGGSSRIPLVSKLTYECTGVLPLVLDQPETVVARGALLAQSFNRQNAQERAQQQSRGGPMPPPPVRASPASGSAFSPLNAPHHRMNEAPGSVLPAKRGPGEPEGKAAKRKRKRAWLISGAVLLVGAMVAAYFVFNRSDDRIMAQYDYRFSFPADWAHTGGGAPAERKVVIKPANARTGNDLVVVQEYINEYDATAERNRLVEDLRSSAEQKGEQYSDFTAEKPFAGKTLIYYRENKGDIWVDWYVAAKGVIRVHIGCQYAKVVPQERVLASCEEVVRTVEITS